MFYKSFFEGELQYRSDAYYTITHRLVRIDHRVQKDNVQFRTTVTLYGVGVDVSTMETSSASVPNHIQSTFKSEPLF